MLITAIQQIQQRYGWFNPERLLVLAVIGWFAAFAPLACILHCHLVGHTEHHHANQPFCHTAEPSQQGQRPSAGLPTIVYDLLPISMLLLVLFAMIGMVGHANEPLRSSLLLQPPAPPPKLACWQRMQAA
jgi:hypothetical protein